MGTGWKSGVGLRNVKTGMRVYGARSGMWMLSVRGVGGALRKKGEKE